jgi:hypothetical protein
LADETKAFVTETETFVTNASQALSLEQSGAQVGKKSGAQTTESCSKRVRLIFEDRRSVQAAPIANRRRHNILRLSPQAPQHVVVLAGEEGFEPSIS